jgi:hypothetical protein
MNAENNFLKNHIILQSLIVINYLIYLLNVNKFFILINIVLILFFFFKILINKFIHHLLFSKIIIIVYAIISLGSPLTEWDGRSIWLFHAKRVFYEGIYSLLDNYFPESHNDYPLLAATLSSSLAFLINGWNEIFPKFSNIILICSPILVLSSVVKSKIREIIFIFVILFVLHAKILTGEMDAILALYFVLSSICTFYLFFNDKNKNIKKNDNSRLLFFYTSVNLIIFSLIRPEAFGVIIIILFTYFLIDLLFFKRIKKNIKKISILMFSLIPILHWKYIVYKANIVTITESLFNFHQFSQKILDFKAHLKLFQLFFFNSHSILSLIFVSFVFLKLFKFNDKNIEILINKKNIKSNLISILLILICVIYYLTISIAILSNTMPIDPFIELGKNIFRYNLAISFCLCYAAILIRLK